MTVHAGSFVVEQGRPDEPPTGFDGGGSIEIAAGRLVLRGSRRRARLALAFAAAAVVSSLFAIAVAIVALDLPQTRGTLKLSAALTVLAGLWIGGALRRLLERRLPREQVEVSLALSSIVEATSRGDRVVLVSVAPELKGATVFVTPRPADFVAELERHGASLSARVSGSARSSSSSRSTPWRARSGR